MNRAKDISLEEAVLLCRETSLPLDTELVAVERACQRVSAARVVAESHVPAFAASAVDGYTLDGETLERLRAGETLCLTVVGQIGAGHTGMPSFSHGETLRIMTGAMLPEKAAAVIKQEDVERHEQYIRVENAINRGDNIFDPGRDIRAGKVLTEKGHVLTPQLMEYAASCGMAAIEVYKIPNIYVINSGSELVMPGIPLHPGQIYNSNRSLVAGLISRAGAIPVMGEAAVKDDLNLVGAELIKGLLACDMVIITGGTGRGDYDVVAEAIQKAGAEALFKGINLAPGRSASAAVWKGHLIYNFTGNPGAVSLLFEVLVRPALDRLMGRKQASARWIDIALESPLRKVADRRNLRKAELVIKDGLVTARPLDKAHTEDSQFIPVILDIKAGQGKKGDHVRALISSGS